jgi:hypothetical protein
MPTFNYNFKIRSLIRDHLDLAPNANFTLQVLKRDDSPPYVATDRVEITYKNNNRCNKPFIIVGGNWLLDKIYREASNAIMTLVEQDIRIEYL